MVSLAMCHFQDRAASWMLRLEQNDEKPSNLEERKRKMIKQFVPTNEKAAARFSLMEVKLKDCKDMDEHLTKFEDLVSLCGTSCIEANMYFFNSLPRAYKGKFAELFPGSQPTDRTGRPSIHVAYDYARPLELSLKLSGELHKSDGQRSTTVRHIKKQSRTSETTKRNKKREWKDPEAVSWGKAKTGEILLYKKHRRCFECGKKGWKDCSCHLEKSHSPNQKEG